MLNGMSSPPFKGDMLSAGIGTLLHNVERLTYQVIQHSMQS